MNGQWNWLIGRKLSLGEVVDVFGESATVRHGDDETRVLLCELLEEDYKEQDRFDHDLKEAIKQAKREALLEAAENGVFEHAMAHGFTVADRLRKMAEETE